MTNPIQDIIANVKEARRLVLYSINQGKGAHEVSSLVKAHDLICDAIQQLNDFQTSPIGVAADLLHYANKP